MQKGMALPQIIFIVLVVSVISFYVGTRFKPIISLPKVSNQSVVTDSTHSSESNMHITAPEPLASASVSPLQAKPKPSKSMIVSEGLFQYSDNQVKYTFSFPKDGGDITGSLDGVCNGNLMGKYNGGEKDSINGSFDGSCSAGPILFIKPQVKATFTGDVHKSNNKISIRYVMTDPTSYQGSFDLDFKAE